MFLCQLFNIKYTSLEKSKELLDKKKITAYLLFQNSDVKIVVNSKGINETITRFVVDDITSQQEMITSLTAEQASSYYKTGKTDFDYQKVYKDVINLVNQNSIKLNNIYVVFCDYIRRCETWQSVKFAARV